MPMRLVLSTANVASAKFSGFDAARPTALSKRDVKRLGKASLYIIYTATRFRARYFWTREPVCETTPAKSWPRTKGMARSPRSRVFQSIGLTPAAMTRTRISCAAGAGCGMSRMTAG